MQVVIISGRSGSGKTIALHSLEDLGFYCVDNLPLTLVASLINELGSNNQKVAISIDSRNLPCDNNGNIPNIINQIKTTGNQCTIIYIDANSNILLKRFSETRRKHPLTKDKTSLLDAIEKEQQILAPIASLADFTLDTSDLSQHQLHNLIRDRILHLPNNKLQVLIQSFGFKYGLPPDADYVFDVRCLPNPYWQQELKNLNGLDAPVQKFLASKDIVNKMLTDIQNFASNWIPHFQADNRSYLSLAIGCTGGKHRSVFLADNLARNLKTQANVILRHRELEKALA